MGSVVVQDTTGPWVTMLVWREDGVRKVKDLVECVTFIQLALVTEI